MRKVAAIQSNYIPWKGYFDIIHDVDLFVFYDTLQYTTRDWRNRNKIKSSKGTVWLTIPVGACQDRLICDVLLPGDKWAINHWETIRRFYSKAPYFKKYKGFFEHVYLEANWTGLSQLNQYLITAISRSFLGITTDFKDSREYDCNGAKLNGLLNLLSQAGAQSYVSGPAAKSYIDEKRFAEAGI